MSKNDPYDDDFAVAPEPEPEPAAVVEETAVERVLGVGASGCINHPALTAAQLADHTCEAY